MTGTVFYKNSLEQLSSLPLVSSKLNESSSMKNPLQMSTINLRTSWIPANLSKAQLCSSLSIASSAAAAINSSNFSDFPSNISIYPPQKQKNTNGDKITGVEQVLINTDSSIG